MLEAVSSQIKEIYGISSDSDKEQRHVYEVGNHKIQRRCENCGLKHLIKECFGLISKMWEEFFTREHFRDSF